jgi:hypothetical protein
MLLHPSISTLALALALLPACQADSHTSAAGGSGTLGGSAPAPSSGGMSGASGAPTVGGNAGAPASGGAVSGGGDVGGAGQAGAPVSGGSSGGNVGGAAGTCPGSCAAPAATSCAAPTVRVTDVDLGGKLDYSTDETFALPLALAAKPGGGSLIAWMTGYAHYGSSTTSLVHIGELDCNDQLVGTPFTLQAHDFQDLAADANGGVVVVTRDSQGGPDAQHCGDVDKLCVTPSDRPGCYDVNMVRFDCAGKELWATQLDSASANAPGYTSGSGQNYFVWWYQHHGRIAYDGANYAAYFCDAITVTNDSCVNGAGKVDIHEGDRMQVVGPTGELLKGHDSFALGCSHSWTTRIVWDPRTQHFVTVCATDNACRMALSPGYKTIVSATCDGTLFGGDVVNATVAGYWMAWSYQGQVKLEHFTTGASDQTVTTAGDSQNPHLVAYGAKNMLLTWKSGAALAAQIYDAGSGTPVGEQFSVPVSDHPWQSWKSFPDGSVAWASTAAASSTVRVARVMPCAD